MSINRLIESIGLSADELKPYILREIDEFLRAEAPADQEEEFGDVLFALLSMAWAHTGRHYALQGGAFEPKIKQRLRSYAALTKRPLRYSHDRIAELRFGVLHFAFGNFGGPWQQFDALKNGTVAEISLLTDAPFVRPGEFTNHCIVTFDDVDCIEYDILYASSDIEGGNTVRCRVPDFMFRRAKRELAFEEFAEFLALQVLAALDELQFAPGAIAHFHSWESGFLIDSDEFRTRVNSFKTIFSPYLTTGRLRSVVEKTGGSGWTMTDDELAVASRYERKLTSTCMRVVLESARDCDFYGTWVHPERLDVRSFAQERSARFATNPSEATRLTFVAGGRPVREKGFVELCKQFALLRNWAASRDIKVSLSILCRERRADKGADYIAAMERTIEACGLKGYIEIEPKISLDQLRHRIEASTALIVPSLYDPFCLMPTYAVEVKRPAFVSCHAGVSENIKSRQFTFDPEVKGDLLRAVSAWYENRPMFEYVSCFPSYRELYLSRETPQPWG
jgi:hypothetical protein